MTAPAEVRNPRNPSVAGDRIAWPRDRAIPPQGDPLPVGTVVVSADSHAGLPTEDYRAYHDADYIAARSDTPAHIIRTKLGWRQKNVPGPDDHTVAMGLKAARKALFWSGLGPEDIDLVIWSGEEVIVL